MTDKKSNIVLMVSTAVFAVLSLCLMLSFKLNESFFDTHGRIGYLAETEQNTILEENAKAVSYKKNIKVSIDDKADQRLILPLLSSISIEKVSVREEFTAKKLVITLQDAIELIAGETLVTTDSSIMEAVGLYKQENNVVLEIYEKSFLAYDLQIEDNKLIVSFNKIEDSYDKKIIVYVPFEKKDRLYSEEWITSLKSIVGDNNKLYLCSQMREEYTSEQVLDFAKEINADALLELDYIETYDPEYVEIIYNEDYFIPYFGSTQLASLMKSCLEEKSELAVTAYKKAGEGDILVKDSKCPAAKAVVYVQTHNEGIEEKYTLNHSLMESLSEVIKNVVE